MAKSWKDQQWKPDEGLYERYQQRQLKKLNYKRPQQPEKEKSAAWNPEFDVANNMKNALKRYADSSTPNAPGPGSSPGSDLSAAMQYYQSGSKSQAAPTLPDFNPAGGSQTVTGAVFGDNTPGQAFVPEFDPATIPAAPEPVGKATLADTWKLGIDAVFKDNPIARFFNRPFAKGMQTAVPNAPMIGTREDGTYGELPGTNARQQFAERNPIASTGNETADKALDFVGEMGSMFVPINGAQSIVGNAAGIVSRLKNTNLGMKADEAIGNVAAKAANAANPALNNFGINISRDLATKTAQMGAHGAALGGIYGAAAPLAFQDGDLSKVPLSVAENAAMFAAGEAAMPFAGAAFKQAFYAVGDSFANAVYKGINTYHSMNRGRVTVIEPGGSPTRTARPSNTMNAQYPNPDDMRYAIQNRVVENLDDVTKVDYDQALKDARAQGIPEDEANRIVLDTLAKTPEGELLIAKAAHDVAQSHEVKQQAAAPSGVNPKVQQPVTPQTNQAQADIQKPAKKELPNVSAGQTVQLRGKGDQTFTVTDVKGNMASLRSEKGGEMKVHTSALRPIQTQDQAQAPAKKLSGTRIVNDPLIENLEKDYQRAIEEQHQFLVEQPETGKHNFKPGDFVQYKSFNRTGEFLGHNYGKIAEIQQGNEHLGTMVRIEKPYKNKQVPNQTTNSGWYYPDKDQIDISVMNDIPAEHQNALALSDADTYGMTYEGTKQHNEKKAELMKQIRAGQAEQPSQAAEKAPKAITAKSKKPQTLDEVKQGLEQGKIFDTEHVTITKIGENRYRMVNKDPKAIAKKIEQDFLSLRNVFQYALERKKGRFIQGTTPEKAPETAPQKTNAADEKGKSQYKAGQYVSYRGKVYYVDSILNKGYPGEMAMLQDVDPTKRGSRGQGIAASKSDIDRVVPDPNKATDKLPEIREIGQTDSGKIDPSQLKEGQLFADSPYGLVMGPKKSGETHISPGKVIPLAEWNRAGKPAAELTNSEATQEVVDYIINSIPGLRHRLTTVGKVEAIGLFKSVLNQGVGAHDPSGLSFVAAYHGGPDKSTELHILKAGGYVLPFKIGNFRDLLAKYLHQEDDVPDVAPPEKVVKNDENTYKRDEWLRLTFKDGSVHEVQYNADINGTIFIRNKDGQPGKAKIDDITKIEKMDQAVAETPKDQVAKKDRVKYDEPPKGISQAEYDNIQIGDVVTFAQHVKTYEDGTKKYQNIKGPVVEILDTAAGRVPMFEHYREFNQTTVSEQLMPDEMDQIVSVEKKAAAAAKAKPETYQILRRGTAGENLDAESKPHGLYVSMVGKDFKTPHADVGDTDYKGTVTLQNPLKPDEIIVEHARFNPSSKGPASAGVAALKKLVPEERFNELLKMKKSDLVKLLDSEFPGPDYSKYTDSYELLEGYAAQLARKAGYDGIVFPDSTDPNFSEIVVLNNKGLKFDSAAEPQKASASGDPIQRFQSIRKEIRAYGDYTAADVKEAFNILVSHEAEMKADIMKRINASADHKRKRANTKAEMVEKLYDGYKMELVYADGDSFSMEISFGADAQKKRDQAVENRINNMTDESIQAYKDKKQAERDKAKKIMENPETLEELRRKKYNTELTADEQARLDELEALNIKERKQEEKAKSAAVLSESGMYTVSETKHTKTGETIFVVKLNNRVETDVFKKLRVEMGRIGGSWSKFTGGFNFNADPREKLQTAFPDAQNAPSGDSTAVQAETSVQPHKTAERLRELADNMQQTIDDKYRDRLSNTAKRSREAAYAANEGDKLTRIQTIMRNLADAMESGDATHLDGITARTHIELLERLLRSRVADVMRADGERITDNNGNYQIRDPKLEDINGMEYPKIQVNRENLQMFLEGLRLAKIPGTARKAAKLDKVIQPQDYIVNVEYNMDDLLDLIRIAKNLPYKDQKVVRPNKGDIHLSDYAERLNDSLMNIKRLQAMGIEKPEQLRSALREFLQYREGTGVSKEALKQRELKAKGEEAARSNIPGFFPTPKTVVERMIDEAGIEKGMRVLEPSAGKGNIADIIRETHTDLGHDGLHVIEYNNTLRSILEEKDYNVVGEDFTAYTIDPRNAYDRIIMNPPFENGQDIDHVMHAFDLLKPGGRIVAIMGEGAFGRSDAKAKGFREWLDEMGGVSEQLPQGSFKTADRPTGVSTRIVTVDKGASDLQVAATVEKPKTEPITLPDGQSVSPDLVKGLEQIYMSTSPNLAEIKAIQEAKPESVLLSYARWGRGGDNKKWTIPKFFEEIGYRPRIILDSGAFTFSNKGKDTGLTDIMEMYGGQGETPEVAAMQVLNDLYATDLENNEMTLFHNFVKFVQENRENVDWVVNMDDRFDGELSLFAYRMLRELDVPLMPVFHFGHDPKLLDEYVQDGAEYIGLGGSVGKTPTERVKWANEIAAKYPNVDFHLLGTVNEDIFNNLEGIKSVDGAAWWLSTMYPKNRKPGQNRHDAAVENIQKKEATLPDKPTFDNAHDEAMAHLASTKTVMDKAFKRRGFDDYREQLGLAQEKLHAADLAVTKLIDKHPDSSDELRQIRRYIRDNIKEVLAKFSSLEEEATLHKEYADNKPEIDRILDNKKNYDELRDTDARGSLTTLQNARRDFSKGEVPVMAVGDIKRAVNVVKSWEQRLDLKQPNPDSFAELKDLSPGDVQKLSGNLKESNGVEMQVSQFQSFSELKTLDEKLASQRAFIGEIQKRRASQARNRDMESARETLSGIEKQIRDTQKNLAITVLQELAKNKALDEPQRQFLQALADGNRDASDLARTDIRVFVQKLAAERALPQAVGDYLGDQISLDPFGDYKQYRNTHREYQAVNPYTAYNLETQLAQELKNEDNVYSIAAKSVATLAESRGVPANDIRFIYHEAFQLIRDYKMYMNVPANSSLDTILKKAIDTKMKSWLDGVLDKEISLEASANPNDRSKKLRELMDSLLNRDPFFKVRELITGQKVPDFTTYRKELEEWALRESQRDAAKSDDGAISLIDHTPPKTMPKKVSQVLDKPNAANPYYTSDYNGQKLITDRHAMLLVSDSEMVKLGDKSTEHAGRAGHMQKMVEDELERANKELTQEPLGTYLYNPKTRGIVFKDTDGNFIVFNQKYYDFAVANKLKIMYSGGLNPFVYLDAKGNFVGLFVPFRNERIFKTGTDTVEIPKPLEKPSIYSVIPKETVQGKSVEETLAENIARENASDNLGFVPGALRGKKATSGTRPAAGPKTGSHAFTNPDIEKRFQESVVPKERLWAKVAEKMTKFRNRISREFEHLPHTAEFAQLRADLLRLNNSRGIASDRTYRNLLQGITRKLDRERYDLFRRKVFLDDLHQEDLLGHDLPWGYDSASLAEDKAMIDAKVAQEPFVQESLQIRRSVWEELKTNYIDAHAAVGNDVAEKLQRVDYVRHQVIDYAATRLDTSGKSKLRTPNQRGFLRQRKGYAGDINSDYLQAESEVMVQMLHDIDRTKVIKMVDDKYNKIQKYKNEAKAANQDAIEAVIEAEKDSGSLMADVLNKKGEKIGEEALSWTEMELKNYNKKMAIAFDGFSKMKESALWKGENGEFKKAVELLTGDRVRPNDFNMDSPTPNGDSVFRYVAALAKRGDELGVLQALTILKAISGKRNLIKTTLGDDFKTWKSMLPEDYAVWQPIEGDQLYMAQAADMDKLAKHIAGQLFPEINDVDDLAEYLHPVLAKGGRKREFAIPQAVADTLDNLGAQQHNSFYRANASIMRILKIQFLIGPTRVFRYNMRNLTGDLDKLIANNPGALKYVTKSARELMPVVFRESGMPTEMQEWFNRGGMHTLLQTQEMGDIGKLQMFMRKHRDDTNLARRLWDGYWKTARNVTDYREAIFRYANYLSYLDQIEANIKGGKGAIPNNYGSSIPEEVDALDNIRDKAYKLGTEALIDYNATSVLGKELRETSIPFWSFMEGNMKTTVQWLKNAARDDKVASAVGRRLLGKVVARSPYYALKWGRAAILLSAFTIATQIWNHTVFPDEEEELPESIKRSFHIVTGRDGNGNARYFSNVGVLKDVLEWFGVDQAAYDMYDILSGRRTFMEVAVTNTKKPFNKLINSSNAAYKFLFEETTGYKLYPDAFNPTRITDRGAHFADLLGFKKEYNAVKDLVRGQDAKDYSVRNWVDYGSNPGEAAYYDVIELKRRYMKRIGKAPGKGSFSAKSEALYDLKRALRYGDEDATERYLNQYVLLGGTARGYNASLRALDPLYGLSKTDMGLFMQQLHPTDQVKLERARQFFLDELLGGNNQQE